MLLLRCLLSTFPSKTVWRLLTTMESKWKPITKLPFLLPWHSLASLAWAGIWDDSFRWTWGAAILLYMYWMVGWEDFVTNLKYLFQLPPKLLFPWVCFTGGGGWIVWWVRSITFLKDKSTLKIHKVIARNKNCEWIIPSAFCTTLLYEGKIYKWASTPWGNRHLNIYWYFSSPELMATWIIAISYSII